MSTTQLQGQVGELHAAAVAAVFARPVKPCTECGTAMTHGQGTDGGKDVFTEVAADGSVKAPASDLVQLFDASANWLGADNPYEYLAKLGDLCTEALSVKRRETTWLYERVIREYAGLKVRLDTGSIYHRHMPAREPWAYVPNRAPRGVVMPHHCGQPAHLRPSGWYCRGCGDLLTDESAELREV
jgi:hypothetical protein